MPGKNESGEENAMILKKKIRNFGNIFWGPGLVFASSGVAYGDILELPSTAPLFKEILLPFPWIPAAVGAFSFAFLIALLLAGIGYMCSLPFATWGVPFACAVAWLIPATTEGRLRMSLVLFALYFMILALMLLCIVFQIIFQLCQKGPTPRMIHEGSLGELFATWYCLIIQTCLFYAACLFARLFIKYMVSTPFWTGTGLFCINACLCFVAQMAGRAAFDMMLPLRQPGGLKTALCVQAILTGTFLLLLLATSPDQPHVFIVIQSANP